MSHMVKPIPVKRPNTKGESLGQFLRGRERMLHVSAYIIDHPLFTAAVNAGSAMTYQGPRFMVGSTHTARHGNNERKRQRRAVSISIAGSVRAARRRVSQVRASAHG